MSDVYNYSVVVQWSDQDEAYVALVPELPGVSAVEEDPAEAVREVHEAAALMVEELQETGQAVPAARGLKRASGQLRVRMPRSLHERLALLADSEAVSLNTLIVGLLAEGAASRSAVRAVERGIQNLRELFTTEQRAVVREAQAAVLSVRLTAEDDRSFDQGVVSTSGVSDGPSSTPLYWPSVPH